jgi:hypothetical protein
LQYNRVLWMGFDHAGPPDQTPEALDSRRRQISSPHASAELKIAVESPEGDYVASAEDGTIRPMTML